MKIQTQDDKILNTLVLLTEFRAMPARAFVPDLGNWECGAAACIGGWVARHPHFMWKGVWTSDIGPRANSLAPSGLSYELFGDWSMFEKAQLGETGSAKQIAIRRLRNRLDALLSQR